MLHSIPLTTPAAPCFTLGRAARGVFTVGYAAFSSGDGRPLAHRLLPLNFPVLILDFESGAALLTGPRPHASLDGPTSWAHGISIGLTPVGAAALAGLPMSEISGQTAEVDLSWASTLAALPSWTARSAWLDAVFSCVSSRAETIEQPGSVGDAGPGFDRLSAVRRRAGTVGRPGSVGGAGRGSVGVAAGSCRAGTIGQPGSAGGAQFVGRGEPASDAGPGVIGRGEMAGDPSLALLADARWRPSARVTAAWWRLQRPAARVADVATGVGLTRRRLERDFRREIGLSPGAVARTARLQRSISGLLRGDPPSAAAVAGGFADQSHLTRTMHSAVGLTPAAFRAFVQDVAPPAP
jgi:AraC-like DNA-binding protein